MTANQIAHGFEIMFGYCETCGLDHGTTYCTVCGYAREDLFIEDKSGFDARSPGLEIECPRCGAKFRLMEKNEDPDEDVWLVEEGKQK